MWSALVCEEGVAFGVCGGDLEVVPGGGMNVQAQSGAAFIEGENVACQGMYFVQNDAPVTLAIAASDPTDPRIDLVIAHVYDAAYGDAETAWHLEVITGTPSPAPTAPTAPANSIVLAEVFVPAGATEITSANITDRRQAYGMCAGAGEETVVFNNNGTFSKADYPSASQIRVRVQAGGGEGGHVFAGTGTGEGSGGGGGGGGYAESLLDVASLPDSVPVTVGAGGTAGGGDGNPGGTSSFGALVVATGGQGGITSPRGTDTMRVPGGVGGVGTAGQILIKGSDGGNGTRVSGNRLADGHGGSSHMGGSVVANTGVGAGGPNGYQYGGGGAGASGTTNPLNGGDGAKGVVIVEVM